MDIVFDEHGEEINIMDLEHHQLGVRMMIFQGEDENGECYGDPPMLNLDICYSCYEQDVQGNETEWIPTIRPKDIASITHNGKRLNCLRENDLCGRTFEELFAEGQSWEWDDLNGDGNFIFRGSEYTCNECGEELLDGIYNLGHDNEPPTLWDNERNQQVKI